MDRKKILQQIANTLHINVQQVKQDGLLQGKFGIAIFFYHYARYTGDESYNDFPNEYIDYISNKTGKDKAENFAEGLSGIGWGIDYLIKNRFIDVADDNIFEEVDNAILQFNLSDFEKEIELPIPLFSKGLYFLQRKNDDTLKTTIPQIERFLQKNNPLQLPVVYIYSIMYVLSECIKMNIEPDLGNNLFEKLQSVFAYKNGTEIMNKEEALGNFWFNFIFPNRMQPLSQKTSFFNKSSDHLLKTGTISYDHLSIYNGLAGIGLSLMSK